MQVCKESSTKLTMTFTINLYRHCPKNRYRFALGKMSDNPLIYLGLNPSIGEDTTPNRTVRRIMHFAEREGFNGFLLINLSAQRALTPPELHKRQNRQMMAENHRVIAEIFSAVSRPKMLLGYGNNIELRPYLLESFKTIMTHFYLAKGEAFYLGELTTLGHPRHPLYLPNDAPRQSWQSAPEKKGGDKREK